MTPLVLPDPKQLGTPYAESMHSLIARTATTYCVPLNRCLRLAVLSGADNIIELSSYKTLKEWVGQGSLCTRLVRGVELLSGRTDTVLTTFQNLDIGQSRGFVSDKLRLCPSCLHPEHGSGYGMLAHQLRYVRHCPLHGCDLIDRCSCGAFFGIWKVSLSGYICSYCKAALWKQIEGPRLIEPFPAWREQQMWELVAYSSDPNRLLCPNEWAGKFHSGIDLLINSLDQYTKVERIALRTIAKRSRMSPGARPSLNTLLELAVMQARGVVDFLLTPDAALTPRLLDIGSVKVERDERRTKSKSALSRARKVLEDLLALPSEAELPSVRSLVLHGSIDAIHVWRSDRLLLERYQKERRRRRACAKSRIQKRARYGAELLVQERIAQGVVSEIRRDGAQLMISTGATKEIAEQALRSVLLGWSVIVENMTLAERLTWPQGLRTTFDSGSENKA